MEHAYSTAIDVNADAMKRASEALTAVTAHEFFHLWNVKRIRPQTLEPVDYTKENYTRALWFSEGVHQHGGRDSSTCAPDCSTSLNTSSQLGAD